MSPNLFRNHMLVNWGEFLLKGNWFCSACLLVTYLPGLTVRSASSESKMPSFWDCSWMGDMGQLGRLAQSW